MHDIYRDIAALIVLTVFALAAICVALSDSRKWEDEE